MGLVLILLGLLTAGVVADYIAENDLLTAPNDTVTLFGTHITVSGAGPIVAAFLAGVITLLLIVIGIGLLRGSWGRRRALKHRIIELEWQNTELRSRERLREAVEATHAQQVVQVPEPEIEAEQVPAAPASEPSPEGIGASN